MISILIYAEGDRSQKGILKFVYSRASDQMKFGPTAKRRSLAFAEYSRDKHWDIDLYLIRYIG